MNKRIAAGISAGLVAGAFAISCFSPVTAHADAGELAGAVDYFMGLESAEVQALSPAGFAVAGAVFAINQALSHPIEGVGAMDASSLTTFSGMYRVSDGAGGWEYRLGTASIYSGSFNLSDGEGMAFLASADYDCVCRFYGSFSQINATMTENGAGSGNWIGGFTGIGATGSFELVNYKNNEVVQTGSAYFPQWHFNVSTRTNSIGNLYTMAQLARLGFQDYSRPDLLGNAQKITLPAGTIDTGYTQILINWVDENYPEYTYLFPDIPPEPIYPTDFVTGIPKDWTIENPNIPEYPHIGFDIPDADFDVIKPSEQIAEYTDGIGFWWALTSKMLDVTNLKSIAIFALGLGVLGFVLWHLGR